MSEKQPRPGHATLAGGVIIGSSIILVLSAWQRISTLHTLEVREAFQRTLDQPLWSETGLTVDGMATAIRVLCLVGAGAAAASTVLGVQVFKRSSSARIVLTALSPLLLIGGIATDGFLAPMVVAGIAMLWLQPTRDWYAGRPWLQAYEQRRAERLAALRAARGETPRAGRDEQSTTQPNASQQVEAPQWWSPPAPPQPGGPQPAQPQVIQPQPGPPSGHGRAGVVRPKRPQALVLACVGTWVVSSFVLLGLVLVGAVMPSQKDELFAEAMRQEPRMIEDYQLTENSLLAGVYIVLVGFALWAIVAVVLALLAFNGQNWARITLVVSAACAGALTLLMSIGAWPLVTMVFVLASSVWLLLRPEVGRWYRR